MNIYMDQRFHKAYRLCGVKTILALMQEPVTLKQYPFLLKKRDAFEPTETYAQWVLVVPKKRFRHANVRNGIRRKMRECIRKNQHDLMNHLAAEQKWMQFALYYIGPEDPTSLWLEKKTKELMEKIPTIL